MEISFSAFDKQHDALLPEILASIKKVLQTGSFVLGDHVAEFEKQFAAYHGRQYAIGVNSGTDALVLSLRAMGIGQGDEVITTANTFITTISSIALVGGKPILVDIDDNDNIDVEQIEKAITEKTKAILPVHWTGRPCNMDRLCEIAEKHNLKIIEDCAQAISAKYKGQLVGTFGEVGCFSLHPFKTLNACGDAGIIITDNSELTNTLKILRHNGLSMDGSCHYWSNNSRLDALQAAILMVKFNHFEAWTKRRIEIANYYTENLKDIAEIIPPRLGDDNYYSVYHIYTIKAQNRDALHQYLRQNDVTILIDFVLPRN